MGTSLAVQAWVLLFIALHYSAAAPGERAGLAQTPSASADQSSYTPPRGRGPVDFSQPTEARPCHGTTPETPFQYELGVEVPRVSYLQQDQRQLLLAVWRRLEDSLGPRRADVCRPEEAQISQTPQVAAAEGAADRVQRCWRCSGAAGPGSKPKQGTCPADGQGQRCQEQAEFRGRCTALCGRPSGSTRPANCGGAEGVSNYTSRHTREGPVGGPFEILGYGQGHTAARGSRTLRAISACRDTGYYQRAAPSSGSAVHSSQAPHRDTLGSDILFDLLAGIPGCNDGHSADAGPGAAVAAGGFRPGGDGMVTVADQGIHRSGSPCSGQGSDHGLRGCRVHGRGRGGHRCGDSDGEGVGAENCAAHSRSAEIFGCVEGPTIGSGREAGARREAARGLADSQTQRQRQRDDPYLRSYKGKCQGERQRHGYGRRFRRGWLQAAPWLGLYASFRGPYRPITATHSIQCDPTFVDALHATFLGTQIEFEVKLDSMNWAVQHTFFVDPRLGDEDATLQQACDPSHGASWCAPVDRSELSAARCPHHIGREGEPVLAGNLTIDRTARLSSHPQRPGRTIQAVQDHNVRDVQCTISSGRRTVSFDLKPLYHLFRAGDRLPRHVPSPLCRRSSTPLQSALRASCSLCSLSLSQPVPEFPSTADRPPTSEVRLEAGSEGLPQATALGGLVRLSQPVQEFPSTASSILPAHAASGTAPPDGARVRTRTFSDVVRMMMAARISAYLQSWIDPSSEICSCLAFDGTVGTELRGPIQLEHTGPDLRCWPPLITSRSDSYPLHGR